MTKNLWLILVLILLASVPLAALSVYDVQHPTNLTDTTYPSPYAGQTVTLNNVVVTAKGYSGSNYVSSRWFVADPEGGPWTGIYIYDTANAAAVAVGDIVDLTGLVSEYFNFTEIGPLTNVTVISHNNPLPAPVSITTGMLTQPSQIEQYEGMLVQVQNVRVTSVPSATYYEWYVTDNSGNAQIDDGFIVFNTGLTPVPYVNETFVRIRGIIDYGHSEYAINPRTLTDIVQSVTIGAAQISFPPIDAPYVNTEIDIPITTSALDPSFNIRKFSFALKYDPQKLEILEGSIENTILEGHETGSFQVTYGYSHADTVYVTYEIADTLDFLTSTAEIDTLLILKARTKSFGTSLLKIFNFKYNDTIINATNITSGSVNIPVVKKRAFMNIYNPSYASNPKYTMNHFNPKQEKIHIDFGGNSIGNDSPDEVTSNFKGIIRIYDSQGRLVATPFNAIINNSTGISWVEWDGRNSELNFVPIGLYYCHAEIIDRISGDKQTVVQPIVVGTPLK